MVLAQDGPAVLAGLAVGRHGAAGASGAGAASAGAGALPQAEDRVLERDGAACGAGVDVRTGAPGAADAAAAPQPAAAADVGPPVGAGAPAPHGRDGSGWRGAGGGVDAGRWGDGAAAARSA
ncbi:hypothetical protein QUV83_09150 [Cellulomonas cellasea]|uniref:hypothetical protein n=1 Tax=Cellulomonas cellasea TaxID=43670 RepID=UPI0025A35AAB|nr:hypothetical protein [Cellulomonas cellasea]MDM8084929.1 hypothetical protein [Cellulomonas cellasea]